MKTRDPLRKSRRNSLRGFTMIEIAIALGVIAFALVAIVGILPIGLQVQRDNRAETIINQDATFWMDAIKNGARGLDELVTQVDRIEIHYNNGSTMVSKSGFTTGRQIIGLLSTSASTNAEVYATIWAISGSASEKEPLPADRAIAFKYVLRVISTQTAVVTNTVSFLDQTIVQDPVAPIDAAYPLNTFHDLRLTLAYPVVREPPGATLRELFDAAPRRQTFRMAVERNVVVEQFAGDPDLYTFFTP